MEALHKMRRQARSIVFREISEDYNVPLGVWAVREMVREALEKKPLKFTTLQEALEYLKTKLVIPLSEYLKKSTILRQKTLAEF